MNQEIKLPDPDTHCWDDDSSKDVWSYSPELVRQIIEADRAQRGEPVLWRYRDSEQCIKPLDGYTPGEGWTPLYTAPQPERKPMMDQTAHDMNLVAEKYAHKLALEIGKAMP